MNRYLTFLTMAGAVGATSPAAAERVEDRFWLQGGAFFGSVDSRVRIDSVRYGTIGTRVDLERDIGLSDNDTVPYVLAGARLGRAFRIEAEYLELSRTGSNSLSRAITIDDTTYAPAADVTGRLDSKSYRVALGWSPLLTDKGELGVSVGAHITDFKVAFDGIGSVVGVGGTRQVSERRERTAPLPTIGLYGSYNISRMFSLHGRVDLLKLKIGDYKGELVDALAGAQARIIRNVGIGAGYRYTYYNVRVSKTSFTGRVKYDYQGPVVFAELAF